MGATSFFIFLFMILTIEYMVLVVVRSSVAQEFLGSVLIIYYLFTYRVTCEGL